MSVTRWDLEQLQPGKAIGSVGITDEEETWLDIFDSLYSEDAEELDTYQAYYDGDQQLLWSTTKFQEIFGLAFSERFRDNWCEVVVDATAERLTVLGFSAVRLENEETGEEDNAQDPSQGQDEPVEPAPEQPPKPPAASGRYTPPRDPNAPPDRSIETIDPITGENRKPGEKKIDPELDRLEKKAGAIWQRNKLDGLQQILHTQAIAKGKGYLMCWPDDDGYARIYYNDAMLIRTWYDENGDLECAAKQWQRPDGTVRRNLYFKDRIEKWVLSHPTGNTSAKEAQIVQAGQIRSAAASWERFQDDEDDAWPVENPYERVPVFPFLNKPHNAGEGVSEIKNTIIQQDMINKMAADMMVASEYGAFMQKVIASKGRPKEGWKHGPNQLWSTTDTDAKWGQFDASPLQNFIDGIEMWVSHVAATSRTPMHYFSQQAEIPSGEALKSAESGLVKKTEKKSIFFGMAWEEAMRMAVEIETGKAWPEDVFFKANWDGMETRDEKQFWEIAEKKRAAGVPDEVIWEEAGYGPEDISRFKEVQEAQADEEVGSALLKAFDSGTGGGGQVPPALKEIP